MGGGMIASLLRVCLTRMSLFPVSVGCVVLFVCVCAELSCFAVASCAQTMVSEDVRLALAFIILLRLAGISLCFSTHSVLGPFFTVWLPYLKFFWASRALCLLSRYAHIG